MFKRLRSLDPVIVTLTFVLTAFGLAMLLSATGPTAVARAGDSLYFVKRQLLTGVLPGLAAFLFFSLIDYRRWRFFAFAALILSLVLLVAVYLPGIGVTLNGARGWIKIGVFQFQPSELVKFTFLIYLAAWLEKRREAAHDLQNGLVPFLAALGAVMALLVLQPDTGSMTVIVAVALTLYFLAGAPVAWLAALSALGAGALALLLKISPYRAARFTTFLHPELDPKGIGYHINQAMLAIGSGGWLGLGYGNSRQKFLYLPEVEADSISAVMGEELGFVFMLLLIIVFGILVARCFKIARAAPDRFGGFLAAGIGTLVAVEALMNVASMSGIMPMTGITLPFISHGGTALSVALAAMGLVAGIPLAKKP